MRLGEAPIPVAEAPAVKIPAEEILAAMRREEATPPAAAPLAAAILAEARRAADRVQDRGLPR